MFSLYSNSDVYHTFALQLLIEKNNKDGDIITEVTLSDFFIFQTVLECLLIPKNFISTYWFIFTLCL